MQMPHFGQAPGWCPCCLSKDSTLNKELDSRRSRLLDPLSSQDVLWPLGFGHMGKWWADRLACVCPACLVLPLWDIPLPSIYQLNRSKKKKRLLKARSEVTAKKRISAPRRMQFRKMKRQATDWGKIFSNHIFYRGLISRIYKELSKHNNKKTKYSVCKRPKVLNRHFTKEDIQISTWKDTQHH